MIANVIPMISVIIPTFNREDKIIEAVNSVLAQTYHKLEVIIVDDGSTDNTENVVKKYITDPRVKYIKETENRGACYARNIGIKNAMGEFIAFQDSDDIWMKEKLDAQVKFLVNNNADFVFCRLRRGERKSYFPSLFTVKNVYRMKDVIVKPCGSTQTFLGKRNCVKTVLFDENLARYQDWDYLIRMSEKYRTVYQKKTLVIQRIQADSISTSSQKGILSLDYILKKYEKEYKKSRHGKANIFSIKASLAHREGKDYKKYLYNAIKIFPFSAKYWLKLMLFRFS